MLLPRLEKLSKATPLIEISELTRRFGGITAVENLTLPIKEGRTFSSRRASRGRTS